jgi:Sec-independent protein translocase protein TatA
MPSLKQIVVIAVVAVVAVAAAKKLPVVSSYL